MKSPFPVKAIKERIAQLAFEAANNHTPMSISEQMDKKATYANFTKSRLSSISERQYKKTLHLE